MKQSLSGLVRLAVADGMPVEEHRSELHPVVTLTIEDIRPGRARLTAESDVPRAMDDRLYFLAGQEALLAATRSVAQQGERPKTLRLHLDPLAGPWPGGPVEAIANAARLGDRASIATVVVRAGGSVIGRGALVSVVPHPAATNRGTVSLELV